MRQTTKEDYVKAAKELLSEQIDGKNILGYKTAEGRTVIYDKNKNEIAIGFNGRINTYFKPEKGINYFEEQLEKDVKKNGKMD